MSESKTKALLKRQPEQALPGHSCGNAHAAEIIGTTKQLNRTFADGNVPSSFGGHYVNLATERYGIEGMIGSILLLNQAVFPAGVENTQGRDAAMQVALFVEDVISEVRTAFGQDRYPDSTVYHYLARIGFRKGFIGKIKLANMEDRPRPCPKPRCKYYLTESGASFLNVPRSRRKS